MEDDGAACDEEEQAARSKPSWTASIKAFFSWAKGLSFERHIIDETPGKYP